jgi:hypothetical protein
MMWLDYRLLACVVESNQLILATGQNDEWTHELVHGAGSTGDESLDNASSQILSTLIDSHGRPVVVAALTLPTGVLLKEWRRFRPAHESE